MNLCVAHGHQEAFLYPVGLVMDEAAFVRERESGRMVTESELIRQAVAGIVTKGSRNQFSKLVKTLTVACKPAASYFGEQIAALTPAQREGPKTKRSLAEAVMPKGVPKGPTEAE